MSTTTFREGPDRRSLTAWLHQFDPTLVAFDQIMDRRVAAFTENDRPGPVCTGTAVGRASGPFGKPVPRPCKASAMKGYSACWRHVEGEEKDRYDREREELARAEAKKDARRAERKRKRDAATLEARARYLAGRFEPADASQLGYHACGANTLVCDLCDDFSPNDGGSEWSLDHLRECPVPS